MLSVSCCSNIFTRSLSPWVLVATLCTAPARISVRPLTWEAISRIAADISTPSSTIIGSEAAFARCASCCSNSGATVTSDISTLRKCIGKGGTGGKPEVVEPVFGLMTWNRVCQEQERNELEQEGWHGAIVMLLSENHSADQSAFLDLCVSPSASILLFFLLFLLFSTHSKFYSNFFQNQIGRSYSCSQKLPSLTLLGLSLLDLCSSVQSKWHGNAKCTAKCTAPFFHGSWATIRGMVEVMTKRQALKTLWLNLSSNVKLCRNCLNDRQEAKHLKRVRLHSVFQHVVTTSLSACAADPVLRVYSWHPALFIHIYTYKIHVHVRVQGKLYLYIYKCTLYTHMHMHVHVHLHTHTHTIYIIYYIYIYICIFIYIYNYRHTYTVYAN